MKADDLLLRGYIEREADGQWFAICIDLNLYARGDTQGEARDKLHAVLRDYVREALTTDALYVEDLIPRRAPFYFRVRYWWIAALCIFHHARHDLAARCVFRDILPVVPA